MGSYGFETLSLGDTEVAYRRLGDGPVDVVVFSMLGFSSADWWPLQDRLAAVSRVLAFDRPGTGASGSAVTPRTPESIARETSALLEVLGMRRPLVVVGHSQGGLYANALSRVVPTVAGVVMLDPLSPDDRKWRIELSDQEFAASGVDKTRGLRLGLRLSKLRGAWLVKPLLMKGPPFTYVGGHPPEAREAMWRHLTRPQSHATALEEDRLAHTDTVSADLDRLGAFPPVPLRVLYHSPTVLAAQISEYGGVDAATGLKIEEFWSELLHPLVRLSPLGSWHESAKSGHMLHLEDPDFVYEHITAVITQVSTTIG